VSDETIVWVFCGQSSRFPSAIFLSKELAEAWITSNSLSGVLTAYPVDISVYDWAIAKGFFIPKKEEHQQPAFIQKFSSASQEHYHYENGTSD
jgi:hypothetical protein